MLPGVKPPTPMEREKVHARASHRFVAAPERVYDDWLDPRMARHWLRAALVEKGLPGDVTTVAIDPVVGGAFEFSDRRAEGEARHWGRYLRLERPREIVFTWITDPSEQADPSVVTVTITPEGSGCSVQVVHEISAEWKDYLDRTVDGWTRMLRGIEAEFSRGRVLGSTPTQRLSYTWPDPEAPPGAEPESVTWTKSLLETGAALELGPAPQ